MVKLLVNTSHEVDMPVLKKVFSQIEGDIQVYTLNESMQDKMVEEFVKKTNIPYLAFPKNDTLLRDMELADYCDGYVLIGDSPKIRRLIALGSLMKKKIAWFDAKGRFIK